MTQNRNCGLPHPAALAVNVTAVPTTWGDRGEASRLTLVHDADESAAGLEVPFT